MPDFDVIIAGAGLAGACAALHLSSKYEVLLLDASVPASGASGAAAGLINPMMGRKARLAWKANAACDAFRKTLHLAEAQSFFNDNVIIRPVSATEQVSHFHEAAQRHPDYAVWRSAEALCEQYPGLHAPLGGLEVYQGGAIDITALVDAMVAASQNNGARVRQQTRATGWGEAKDTAFIELDNQRVTARRVVLALGYGFRHHAHLIELGLHGVKGQVVRVAMAPDLPRPPLLSGQGYLVPGATANEYIIGSSYEHTFDNITPSPAQTREILARVTRMWPALTDAVVLGTSAGVRVTMRGSRLPVVGPLPGHQRVWLLSAFGSKGLLMAPLLASRLAAFFAQPDQIPSAVRLRGR